ncbi:MAG TPA: hypothetical protein VE994_17595, partial [Terriglobales bacterium]|nr:hypothetical protein [Terriglobales bacterium]
RCHNQSRRNFRLSCAICETRKEKRFCPAVHGRICPVCCGEQREVTLDCPSDCVYLQQARQHEKPRTMEELDPTTIFPEVDVPQSFFYDREHLIVGLSFALAKCARADRSLNDRDIIAALSALAKTYERLVNSGLVYETAATGIAQQTISTEVQKMIEQYRQTEQKHVGYSTLRDSEVLQAIVFLVRLASGRTSGRPKSRAFIDFLFRQFPEKTSVIESPAEAGSRIVIP